MLFFKYFCVELLIFSFRWFKTDATDLEYDKLNLEAENFVQTTVGPENQVQKYYKCPKCPKTFQYKSKFLMHSVRHTKEKTCVCPVCKKLLKSKFSLNSHLRYHEGNIFKCTICLKEYALKSSYDGHVSKYPPDIIFPCTKCERKFHSKVDLVVHQARDHIDNFICFFCNDSFPSTKTLKEHVTIHNGDAPTRYQCEFCGRICSGRQTLNVHRKSLHLGLRSVVCEICGKKLTSKGSLHNHLLMHRGEKPLACEHCGKTFLSRNTLNIHRRTHTGERPHGCPYCEKRFTQRNSLIVHIRKHTGDRPFECDMCEEKFVSKSCWKIHRKSKHQII